MLACKSSARVSISTEAMADIYPFRAVHYNPKLVPDLSKAVTQPYDKITREMQANYYDLSPYNLVRIILGRHKPEDTGEDNVYTRAACTFQDWLREGILTSEAEPGLYPYFEEYTVPGPSRARKRRQGFIALCRLERSEERRVGKECRSRWSPDH